MLNPTVDLRELSQQFAARPLRFYLKYKQTPSGETISEEWVQWSPLGRSIETVTPERVANCKKTKKWPLFDAAYNAWKSGSEMPTTGTPLAAWAGVNSDQAEILRAKGLRTVEDVSDITDSIITTIRMPGVRDLVSSAKAFLASKDQVAAASTLKKVNDENAELRERMAAMEDMIREQMAAKPRRGRPPKVVDGADDDADDQEGNDE